MNTIAIDWHYVDPTSPEYSAEAIKEGIEQAWANAGIEAKSVYVGGSLGDTPFHAAEINIGQVVHAYDPVSGTTFGESKVTIFLRVQEAEVGWEYCIDLGFYIADLTFVGDTHQAETLEEAKSQAEEKALALATAFGTGPAFTC